MQYQIDLKNEIRTPANRTTYPNLNLQKWFLGQKMIPFRILRSVLPTELLYNIMSAPTKRAPLFMQPNHRRFSPRHEILSCWEVICSENSKKNKAQNRTVEICLRETKRSQFFVGFLSVFKNFFLYKNHHFFIKNCIFRIKKPTKKRTEPHRRRNLRNRLQSARNSRKRKNSSQLTQRRKPQPQ